MPRRVCRQCAWAARVVGGIYRQAPWRFRAHVTSIVASASRCRHRAVAIIRGDRSEAISPMKVSFLFNAYWRGSARLIYQRM